MGIPAEKISVAKSSHGNSLINRARSNGFNNFFQPKLTVGPVDDVYEREADAVADKVLRMSDSQQIQGKISTINVQRKCAACEEEELQRKDDGTNEDQSEAPSI